MLNKLNYIIKYISFFLIFIALYAKAFSQTYQRLEIKERTLDFQTRYPVKFVADNPRDINDNDSSIILNNKDTLFRYKIYKFSLLKSDSSTRISILVGINKKNIPLIVVDENFNNVFSDDSVYLYLPSKNQAEFFRKLPQISLSIAQKHDNAAGNINLISLTLSPSIQGTLLLNDSVKISKATTLGLSFYSRFYLSSNLIMDDRRFEIAIIPHPLAVPVLKDSSVANGFPRWAFNVYEKRDGKRDSVIYFNFFGKITENLNEPATAFKILDKYMFVSDFSLDSNFIVVNILDSNSYQQIKNKNSSGDEGLDSFKAFNLNTKKHETYNFTNDNLTLLEFSGSWCLPCKEILPDVKVLHSKYGNKVNFVTMLEEQNLLNAEKYFKENKLLGRTYYENIGEKISFKNKMKVSIYPGFFLIDNNGAIILHTNSTKGLIQIENEIKNRLHQKRQSD